MIEQIIKEATTPQLTELKEALIKMEEEPIGILLVIEVLLTVCGMVDEELKSRDSKPS